MVNFLQGIFDSNERESLRSKLENFKNEPYDVTYSVHGYQANQSTFVQTAPEFLRQLVNNYLSLNSADTLIIKNVPIDKNLDETPLEVFESKFKKGRISENLLLMVGSLLGTPFAIDTENRGFLIHNIYPVERYAKTQSSKSSEAFLTLHTELSCLDTPPDFLVLLGLRESDDAVITPVVKLDEILSFLTPSEAALLHQPLFITNIDESMRTSELKNTLTRPFSVITYDAGIHRWRYDVEYTKGIDEKSSQVVAKIAEIQYTLFHEIVVETGSLVVINNTKLAHARKSFLAKYDGTDRWIQRINIYKRRLPKTFFTIKELITT